MSALVSSLTRTISSTTATSGTTATEARLVLRPRCVHRQVSRTPNPARMSTGRPAAESILSRPLIGSPIHVRSLCACGNSFRHIYCSINFGFSCGSRSDQLPVHGRSLTSRNHRLAMPHKNALLRVFPCPAQSLFACVTRSFHHVSIAIRV